MNRENVFKGHFQVDKITLDNGVVRECLIKNDGVGALVYDTVKDKYIFVEQFRPGVMDKIIEIAAGTCDVEGESKMDCMIREVKEELGYDVDYIECLLSNFYVSPGYTTEKLTIFYCEVSQKIGEGGGIDDEDISIIEMSPEELYDYEFNDAKTIIAILLTFTK